MESTEEGRKNMNEEAKQEESKSGKREVEREEEKIVIKRRCVTPFPVMFLRNSVPRMSWKVLGILDFCSDSCVFSVCVLGCFL